MASTLFRPTTVRENRETLSHILFNYRLGLLLLAIIGGLIGEKFLPIPDDLDGGITFVALASATVVGWLIFYKGLQNPILPFIGLSTIGLSSLLAATPLGIFKPHMLAYGLGIIAAAWALLRDFSFFWSFGLFRGIFIFFLTNIIYLSLYASDFDLSAVKTGYPVDFASDFSDLPARFIVAINATGLLISTVAGLAVFNRHLYYPKRFHQDFPITLHQVFTTLNYFTVGHLIFTYLSGFSYGMGLFNPIYALLHAGLTIWRIRQTPNAVLPWTQISWQKLNIFCMFLYIMALPMEINKTGLLGAGAAYGLFFLLCNLCDISLGIVDGVKRLNRFFWARMLTIIAIPTFVIILTLLGFTEKIMDRLDYFYEGFSSLGTLKVRQGNWELFLNEWWDTLNVNTALFGYGLATSRENIFFLSAMRMAGERTLVQTVHNHYMEMFFDFGLIALTYFSSYIAFIRSHSKYLQYFHLTQEVKLWSIIGLCMIFYLGVYGMMDGIRIPLAITLFTMIAFIDGYVRWAKYGPKGIRLNKHYLQRFNENLPPL